MKKQEFKVGDQVRLKKNLKVGERYGRFLVNLLGNMIFEDFKPILSITTTGCIELKSSHSDLSYYYAPEMLIKKL